MVEYGKLLEDSRKASPPEWFHYWIDYDTLKRLIYEIKDNGKHERTSSNSSDEGLKSSGGHVSSSGVSVAAVKVHNQPAVKMQKSRQFFERLRKEVNKVSEFYDTKLQELLASVNAHTDGMIELRVEIEKTAASGPVPDISKNFKTCKSVYMNLLMLENFAVMNYGGVAKILKKHDKNAGTSTRVKYLNRVLNVRPFAIMARLKEAIRATEHEIQRLIKLSQAIQKRNGKHDELLETSPLNAESSPCFNNKEMIVLDLLKNFARETREIRNDRPMDTDATNGLSESALVIEDFGSSSKKSEKKRNLVETQTGTDRTKQRKKRTKK